MLRKWLSITHKIDPVTIYSATLRPKGSFLQGCSQETIPKDCAVRPWFRSIHLNSKECTLIDSFCAYKMYSQSELCMTKHALHTICLKERSVIYTCAYKANDNALHMRLLHSKICAPRECFRDTCVLQTNVSSSKMYSTRVCLKANKVLKTSVSLFQKTYSTRMCLKTTFAFHTSTSQSVERTLNEYFWRGAPNGWRAKN